MFKDYWTREPRYTHKGKSLYDMPKQNLIDFTSKSEVSCVSSVSVPGLKPNIERCKYAIVYIERHIDRQTQYRVYKGEGFISLINRDMQGYTYRISQLDNNGRNS